MRKRTFVALSVAALVVIVAAAFPIVAGLGSWLVVADPLERATAIVVLSGHVPFRAVEGAALHRQGWAPEIWLTRGATRPEDAALARLGIEVIRDHAYNRMVVERLGVPPPAVRVLARPVMNTVDELNAAADELRRLGGQRLIVVTSKPHSRRVRATWRALHGSLDARIRFAADDPYEPDGWWHRTNDALAVSREVLGLMNVWAGFPVQPDRR